MVAETADDTHADGGDHGHFMDFGIGVFVLALFVGIFSRSAAAGARLVEKDDYFTRVFLDMFTRFPYTVLVMLMGLIIGIIYEINHDVFGPSLGMSIHTWSGVSAEVILFTILPILLFESSFATDVHIMRHEALQVGVLAGPGVMLATFLTAWLSFSFGYDDWDWYTALLFGSMLSATDPVAVVALVKELGMNQRIGTLIEGEGLMNDGSAVVLFNVFRGALISKGGLVAHEVAFTGLRLALGGPLVGVAIGAATSFCLANFTYNDLQSEVTLTVVGCYSCFLIAEGTPLHVSGVLAVVFAGLYLSFYGRGNISVQVEHSLHSFWHLAEYIADTLVFFVAGVVMASKMMADDIDAHDWKMLLALFVSLQFIRGFVVFLSWPVLKQGYGITWQEGVVLTLGGLRGAVGLSLALTVEEFSEDALSRAVKDKIVFHMSGVAFLSLILNGTFMHHVVKGFGLDRVSSAESALFDHACVLLEKRLEKFVDKELKSDKFLGDADYDVVWRYVPCMSAQQYWARIESKRMLQGTEEKKTMDALMATSRAQTKQARLQHLQATFAENGSGARDSPTETQLSMLAASAAAAATTAAESAWALEFDDNAFAHMPRRLRKHWHGLHAKYRTHALWKGIKYRQDSQAPVTTHTNTASKNSSSLKNGTSSSITSPLVKAGGVTSPTAIAQQLDSSSRSIKPIANDTPRVSSIRRSFTKDNASNPETNESFAGAPNASGEGLRQRRAGGRANVQHATLVKERDEMEHILEKMNERVLVSEVAALRERLQRRAAAKQNNTSGGENGDGGGDDDGPGSDALEKGRTRFMTAVRAQYQANHHRGLMRSSVLRTLRESADQQLDHPALPLHDFDFLAPRLKMSPRLQRLARAFAGVPVVAALVNQAVMVHLAFMIELAAEFVRAHQAVDVHALLDEGPESDEVAAENLSQLSRVHELLRGQLPVFPEITHALKTQIATRQLLMYHLRLLGDLVEEGSVTEREHEDAVHQTEGMLVRLHAHPLTEALPQKVDMLAVADFMRGVPSAEVERLASLSTFCTEVFVEPGVPLFLRGETAVVGGPAAHKHGFFVLVRGIVHRSDEDDDDAFSSATAAAAASSPRVGIHGHHAHATSASTAAAGSDGGGGGGNSAASLSSGAPHGGSYIPRKNWKFVVVHPGSTFGMCEQLMGDHFKHDFVTASYCHMLYVDTAALLQKARRDSEPARALFGSAFRAVALKLLPPLLGIDNNLIDPLRLVAARDNYAGWNSQVVLRGGRTTADNGRARREQAVELRHNEPAFLGLRALDSATFVPMLQEDILADDRVCDDPDAHAFSDSDDIELMVSRDHHHPHEPPAQHQPVRRDSDAAPALLSARSFVELREPAAPSRQKFFARHRSSTSLGAGAVVNALARRPSEESLHDQDSEGHSATLTHHNGHSATSGHSGWHAVREAMPITAVARARADTHTHGLHPTRGRSGTTTAAQANTVDASSGNLGSHAAGSSVNHVGGGGGGAGVTSGAALLPSTQWVVEVSASKSYVLLRGRVLGRARRSTASAETHGLLDGVDALASKAHGLEHMSHQELLQLKELLDKLRQAPVTMKSPIGVSTVGHSEPASSSTVAAAATVAVSAPEPLPASTLSSPMAADSLLPEPLSPDEAELPMPNKMARSVSGSAMNSDGTSDADASNKSEVVDPGTAPVPEMAAPCFVRGVKGRLRVSPRTVLMELPRELMASKAALRMLTKLRRKQHLAAASGLDDDDALGHGHSGRNFDDFGHDYWGDGDGAEEEAKETGFVDLMTTLITEMRVRHGSTRSNHDGQALDAGGQPIPNGDEEEAKRGSSYDGTDTFKVF